MAHIYLQSSSSSQVPTSAMVGFVRFLILLSSHPWGKEPLVLPGSDDFLPSSLMAGNTSITNTNEANSHAEKDSDTNTKSIHRVNSLLRKPINEFQYMYIASPYAPTSSPFTTHTPREIIVHRIVHVAQSALNIIFHYMHLCCSTYTQ